MSILVQRWTNSKFMFYHKYRVQFIIDPSIKWAFYNDLSINYMLDLVIQKQQQKISINEWINKNWNKIDYLLWFIGKGLLTL